MHKEASLLLPQYSSNECKQTWSEQDSEQDFFGYTQNGRVCSRCRSVEQVPQDYT